jgi:hypothetical protein
MPSVKDAVWNSEKFHGRGSLPSQSVLALRNLKVGDCKRIKHEDVQCLRQQQTTNGKKKTYCSLTTEINQLRRKQNWLLDYYHENRAILVIRRLAPKPKSRQTPIFATLTGSAIGSGSTTERPYPNTFRKPYKKETKLWRKRPSPRLTGAKKEK